MSRAAARGVATEYVVRVRPVGDGYRATVRECAVGAPALDVRTIPSGHTGIGAASTVPAAILAAVTDARLPLVASEPRRRPYAV